MKSIAAAALMMVANVGANISTTCDDAICNKCSKGQYKDAVSDSCVECPDLTYQGQNAFEGGSCTAATSDAHYIAVDKASEAMCPRNHLRHPSVQSQCQTVARKRWDEAESAGANATVVTSVSSTIDNAATDTLLDIKDFQLTAASSAKRKTILRAIARQWRDKESGHKLKVKKEDFGLKGAAKTLFDARPAITEFRILPVKSKASDTNCSDADVDLDSITEAFSVVLQSAGDFSLKCKGSTPHSKLTLQSDDTFDAECYDTTSSAWSSGAGLQDLTPGDSYTCSDLHVFYVGSDTGGAAGCTDSGADNYDGQAVSDDGSCVYTCQCPHGTSAIAAECVDTAVVKCIKCDLGFGFDAPSESCGECTQAQSQYSDEDTDSPCADGECPVGQGYTWTNSSHQGDCDACIASTGHYSASSTTGQCILDGDYSKYVVANGNGEGTHLADCPAGEVRDLDDHTQCKACASHQYALNGVCTNHAVCDANTNEYETDAGSSTSNVVCGSFTTGDHFCAAADIDAQGSCTQITATLDCVAGQYVTVDPTPTQDRQCGACGEGEHSTGQNAAECSVNDGSCNCDDRREVCIDDGSGGVTCQCKGGFVVAENPELATVTVDGGNTGATCIKADTDACRVAYQAHGCCSASSCTTDCQELALDCGF